MSEKEFVIDPEEVRAIATGFGACVVTDRVTVEGLPVRFMYREEPGFEGDSGWRFCSGMDEDEAYMTDPDNLEVLDVNVVANLDESIVRYLIAPVGSAFEKPPGAENFVATDFDEG